MRAAGPCPSDRGKLSNRWRRRDSAQLGSRGNFGFDAARKKNIDLVEPGLVDPTKVVRTALENAVSVASVLLLTEDNDRNPGAETRSDAGAGRSDMRFAY